MLNKFFSEAVRRFHLYVFLPILKIVIPPDFRIEPRNSILTPEKFSGLWSDIDTALICQNVYQPQVVKLRHRLWLLKKLYPFLGEAEVYTEPEWTEQKENKRLLGQRYTEVRQIRKISWLLEKKSEGGFFYRFKTKKLMGRTLRLNGEGHGQSMEKLSRKLNELLRQKILTECNRIEIDQEDCEGANSYYHTYFNLPIVIEGDEVNQGLKLNNRQAMMLAALFPIDQAALDANREILIKIWTKYPSVRTENAMFTRTEILDLAAAFRGEWPPEWYIERKDYLNWMLANLASLSKVPESSSYLNRDQ